MNPIVTTVLILIVSALSVIIAATGFIKNIYLLALGLMGTLGTSILIFELKFPIYRAWLHFVILIVLSILLVPLLKWHLTNNS